MRNEMLFSLAMGFMTVGAYGAPETLRFEGAKGEFFVKVDYDRAPDRVPPPGASWAEFEKDSAWTEVKALWCGWLCETVTTSALSLSGGKPIERSYGSATTVVSRPRRRKHV